MLKKFLIGLWNKGNTILNWYLERGSEQENYNFLRKLYPNAQKNEVIYFPRLLLFIYLYFFCILTRSNGNLET